MTYTREAAETYRSLKNEKERKRKHRAKKRKAKDKKFRQLEGKE